MSEPVTVEENSIPFPCPHPAPVGNDVELGEIYGLPVTCNKHGRPLSINERFMAARFVRDELVLYDPGVGFYRYDNLTGVWQRKSDAAMREAVSAHVVEYGKSRHIPMLDSLVTVKRMSAIVQALQGINSKWTGFPKKRDYVHVKNGVILFNPDGSYYRAPFSPSYLSRNFCPVDFVEGATCERTNHELMAKALPDYDIDIIWRVLGQSIDGSNPAQRMLIFDGLSGTGKSTIAGLFRLMVGEDNAVQLRTSQLEGRFELFRFIGKTFLVASDVKGDFLDQPGASMLKSLVGNDYLTAEGKQSNELFGMVGNFNVLITANTRLRVKLDSDAGAWRRRMILVRFKIPHTGPKIPHFENVLMAEEGPGILLAALEGRKKAIQEVAASGDLIITPEQWERVDAILGESDSVRSFVVNCTEKGLGDVSAGELAEAYYTYCAKFGWTAESERAFYLRLGDAILEYHQRHQVRNLERDGSSVRGWLGIQLKLPS